MLITCVLSFSPFITVAQTNDEPNEITPIEQPSKEEIEATESVQYDIPNIDQARVEAAWIEMINNVRAESAGDYTIDTGLIKTSIERANHLAKNRKFTKMHQRPGQTCKNYRCYDLVGRFTDRGVSPSAGESI